MLMLTRTHRQVERERDHLADMLDRLKEAHATDGRTIATLRKQCEINASAYRTMCARKRMADETITDLRARLAKFTGPRERDAKGLFLPVGGAK